MNSTLISQRFRGFLPVVIDVETGGFDAKKDALLELAAVLTLLSMWQYTAAAYRYFREAMTTATPH